MLEYVRASDLGVPDHVVELERPWVMPTAEVEVRRTRYYVMIEGAILRRQGSRIEVASTSALDAEGAIHAEGAVHAEGKSVPPFDKVAAKLKQGQHAPKALLLKKRLCYAGLGEETLLLTSRTR